MLMPSLFRFLISLAVLGCLGFGGIYLLANFVEPLPHDVSVRVPPNRFAE